jgi:hypothetical protein
MSLFETDLKLVHAVEDSQFDTGGGPLTNREIADGAIGELIDPIDEVSASIGRVLIYKGGVVADTNTSDRLQNAFLFISEVPSDPLLTVTLTTTGDPFDRLPAIRSHIEAYYNTATPWNGFFLGTQPSEMSSVIMFQRPGTTLPPVGATMAIVMDEGKISEVREYIVVSSVTSELRTVAVEGGDRTVQIVTIRLFDRLTHSFPGSVIQRYDPTDPRTVLKTTFISASAVYYGMTRTTAELASGNNIARVSAIENALVPTSTSSTAHVDLRATGDDATLVPAASGYAVIDSAIPFAPGVTLYCGVSIYPGTLSVTAGGTALTDANGALYAGTIAVGMIDYANGKFTGSANAPEYGGHTVFQFKAAGVIYAPYQTAYIEVTANNQDTNYTYTLPTQPEPGTLAVYYRAYGVDYQLKDRGDGVCEGYDDSFGRAQVRFDTRSVVVSLVNLPDADTYIFFAWGLKSYSYNRGDSTLGKGWFEFITTAPLPPMGFTIAWNDGSDRTATDDGAGNITSDHATGKVFYTEKKIWLMPNTLPPTGTEFVITITPRLLASESFNPIPIDQNGRAVIQLAHTNLRAGTARLEFTASLDLDSGIEVGPDTAPGRLMPPEIHPIDEHFVFRETTAGAFAGLSNTSINHETGAVSFDKTWSQRVRVPVSVGVNVLTYWRYVFTQYLTTNHDFEGVAATVSYYYGDAGASVEERFTAALLMVDVTPDLNENIIPGSVSFWIGPRRYVDSDGKLYADPDPATGAGTLAGSLNLSSGYAGVNAWPVGNDNAPWLSSCATRVGVDICDEVTFRAPGSPVAASSVQLTATDTAGNTITSTADGAGVIESDGEVGFFFYSAAVGKVRFGDWVTASEHTAAPWYHASDIVNGQILKPRPVIASSVRFNCRTVNYIPVNASIIGIDSKRLPKTGKVPVIQSGSWLLIHHTLTTTAATATAGGSIDLGRTGLERVWVRDATGKKLPSDRYAINLATGLFTWSAPLSLAGYSAPFTVYNRKMHRSIAQRVDIAGRIDLVNAPNWTIPAGASVSSALIIGDLQGRLASIFTQGSWDTNNPWVSSTPNTTPTAVYNNTEFSIAVTNRSTTDSYALIFTDSTHYKIESKGRGELATNIPTTSDYTLVNLITGEDEFTIYHLGFGTGWIPGNVIRLDIQGAKFPWNLALTCQPGNHAIVVDHLTLEFAGGV